jgi:Flp pilus assembly protein TadD
LTKLGVAQLHLGDGALSKAEFKLRQAHEIDPVSTSIRNNLVLVLMTEGKEDEARHVLDDIAVPTERAAVQKFAADWVQSRQKRSVE